MDEVTNGSGGVATGCNRVAIGFGSVASGHTGAAIGNRRTVASCNPVANGSAAERLPTAADARPWLFAFPT
jgi:hypothetical protein